MRSRTWDLVLLWLPLLAATPLTAHPVEHWNQMNRHWNCIGDDQNPASHARYEDLLEQPESTGENHFFIKKMVPPAEFL